MTFWGFAHEHPVFTIFLGMWVLLLVETVGETVAEIRKRK